MFVLGEQRKGPPASFRDAGGPRNTAATYSPAFAVPSARRSLTALFGMGRGGASGLWPPQWERRGWTGKDRRGSLKLQESVRAISSARLRASPPVHLRPIDVIVSDGPVKSNLAAGFALRCVQRLSDPDVDTRRCAWRHNRQTRGRSGTVLSY